MKKAPKKKPATKKRNPQDLTLRNLRALKKEIEVEKENTFRWQRSFDVRLNAIADAVSNLVIMLGAKDNG